MMERTTRKRQPKFKLHYDYDKIKVMYVGGKSWTDIAVAVHVDPTRWQSPYNHCRRVAGRRGDRWPWVRHPQIKSRVWSNASRKQHKSVDPMVIMDMVSEFCEERNMSLTYFGLEYLGLPNRAACSKLFAWRTGRVKVMSGVNAARILAAIGEPVRKDLVA